MKRLCAFIVVTLSVMAQTQNPAASDSRGKEVLNFAIDRVGFLRDVNYAYVEYFQIRGTKHSKWSVIVPDVGVICFDDVATYREVFVGAGFEVQPFDSLTIDRELYYDQAIGPNGHAKGYLQPWTRIEYHFPKKFATEAVVFPYIPINGGSTQFVLERAKLEYRGFKKFNFGGGYAAYKDFTYMPWNDRPFASVTCKTKKYGDFEIWIQMFSQDNFQIQFRHAISWKSR